MSKFGNNDIGRFVFGNNEIGKAYLGSNLVFSKGGGPVPEPIAYIRGGGGGTYIDTGITPDATTRVVVWARNFNPGGYIYTWLFGSRVDATSAIFGVVLGINTHAMQVQFANGADSFSFTDFGEYMSNYHKYELNSTGLYVDDTLILAVSAPSFSNNYNIYLYGANDGGVLSQNSNQLPVDICACKIYKNNVLVRDFTPVDTPSVGLYDAVSDTVFTNAGNGSLAYGTFLPNSYVPLEYISRDGSGQQWIDTGVKGSYAGTLQITFMVTGTAAGFYYLAGCRSLTNDAVSDACEISIGNASYPNSHMYWRLGTTPTVKYPVNTNTSQYIKNKKITAVKENAKLTCFYNNAIIGSAQTSSDASSSYQTPINQYIGVTNRDGVPYDGPECDIYHAAVDGKNFVPALYHRVAGLYDTYNDVFYPSESGTAFVAGPRL